MKICDAHCHYHFLSLAGQWDSIQPEAATAGVSAAVVNGTHAGDWEAVSGFVRKHPWAKAAYGIHPWQAPHRQAGWEKDLTQRLAADPDASVGEIGLDAWVEGHDLKDQEELFRQQWEIAREHGRPVSVHCVRAYPLLRQVLKSLPAYPRGFLIHAFNGPPEWIPWFVEKGAHFSFSPYFLLDRKKPQRDAFAVMPPDRILIETDAPDLYPPPEHNPHPLTDPATGKTINHPANLVVALTALAEVLQQPPEVVATLTSANWSRLFGESQIK
jgi:TatD DNase family protein